MRSVRQFGAPLQISTGFASWHRYCTASSSGRQPNFAALNRGCHLCSAGRPSRWALAHILDLFTLAICCHCQRERNCTKTSLLLLLLSAVSACAVDVSQFAVCIVLCPPCCFSFIRVCANSAVRLK